MTLIVTEVSKAGIAMVADSMISFQIGRHTISQQQWTKLFKADAAGMPVGISYWGNIGDITSERFDYWLASKLSGAPNSDLFSLAAYLTEQINRAAGAKLIARQKSAGIHVAGFHAWSDGVSRPTFFHIHNGHISLKARSYIGDFGAPNSNIEAAQNIPTGGLSDGSELKTFLHKAKVYGTKLDYTYEFDVRKQFEVHEDFPSKSGTIERNLTALGIGYVTRNGDHLTDALIEAGIGMPDTAPTAFTMPNGSPQNVGPRLGELIERMKIVIAKHACISSTPMVGGPISVLAICQDGTHFEGSTWKKTE